MGVCRFFLEGRCKFGENCKFEHPRGGVQRSLFGGQSQTWQGSGSGGQRVTFRDSFGTSGQGSSSQYKWIANQPSGQGPDNISQPISTLDHVNTLPKEMETWEKSHMWPFSCVSVDKDLPSLPEFYDICPEELRYEAYLAMKSGNLQSYTQRFQSLLSEFQNKRRQVLQMTADVKAKLMAIIDEAKQRRLTQSSSSGTSAQSSSVFGQNQTSVSSNLFGKSTGATGSSSGTGLFGKPTSGSVFGGHFNSGPQISGSFESSGQPMSHSPGSFGSTGPSMFGKPAGTGSVFGSQSQGQAAQTTNLFGTQNSTSTSLTSAFGQPANQVSQASSLFGNVGSTTTNQPSSFFGSQVVSPPQGLFGKPAADPGQTKSFSSFGNNSQTSQTSLFGTSSSQNQTSATLFGSSASQNQTSATLFGKPVPANMSAPQNLFGSSSSGQAGGSVFGQSQGSVSGTSTTSHGYYTPLSELTEQEKIAFNSKAFQLWKIPIRPPPRELIN